MHIYPATHKAFQSLRKWAIMQSWDLCQLFLKTAPQPHHNVSKQFHRQELTLFPLSWMFVAFWPPKKWIGKNLHYISWGIRHLYSRMPGPGQNARMHLLPCPPQLCISKAGFIKIKWIHTCIHIIHEKIWNTKQGSILCFITRRTGHFPFIICTLSLYVIRHSIKI